jgi:hypothetical protein
MQCSDWSSDVCSSDLALKDARKAIALGRNFVTVHIRIAKCSLALGDLTAANSALSVVRELSFNNFAILTEVQKLEAVMRFDMEGTTACQKEDYIKAVFCAD